MARDGEGEHGDQHGEEELVRRGPSARAILVVVLLALLLWFGLANSARVEVTFFVTDAEVRLIYALGVAAVLGLGVGYLVGRSRERRRWSTRRRRESGG